MNFVRALFLILFLLLASGSPAAGDEQAQRFLDGVRRYQAGEYAQAAALFQEIADKGVRNGRLFYNIGNAYLKAGRLGHAVLWYEKALKLIPEDPDLRFNHDYALSLVTDEKFETGLWMKILFFWRYLFSHRMLQWLAVSLNGGFWFFLSVRAARKRKKMTLGAGMILLISLVMTATALSVDGEKYLFREAVILSEEAEVRSGWDPDATVLFMLHAGTKVRVEVEQGDFVKIRYSEDKIGWLSLSRLGMI